MAKKTVGRDTTPLPAPRKRRRYDDDLRAEAVQMLLDGHSAASVVERLGISSTNLLHQWKRQRIQDGGPVAASLETCVRELEAENLRLVRERDVLKKALAIFGRST